MALYLKHRPLDFSGVIGQDLEITKMKKWFGYLLVDRKQTLCTSMPSVVLISGPTGTGKSTTARILSRMLGVEPGDSNPNYVEMNCADCRGIDDVREIASHMRLAPLSGKARVWVLDEAVQLPKTTQQAMLKMLEDTPKHVYFIPCTSDLGALLPTFYGRGHPIVLKPIENGPMGKLIWKIAELEGKKVKDPVIKAIVALAEGSARRALQYLESVLAHQTEADQLACLDAVQNESLAIDLARAVMWRKGWPEISKIISQLSQEPETVRRVILKYCETVMLGDAQIKEKIRADVVIANFRDHWADCGRAGLITSCWRVQNGN